MRAECELLILGGGCAGLSLAMELAKLGQQAPRTIVLEQRTHFENDRTWCFWGDDTTPFSQLATCSWKSVSVGFAGNAIRLDCRETPYRMLASNQFYSAALNALTDAPKLSLNMGSQVLTEPEFIEGLWQVETHQGRLTACNVVDTRPQSKPSLGGALLWQSFYGHEIDCESSVFDSGCVNLMEFLPASTQGVSFSYVLPLSSNRALVESTVFSEVPLTASMLASDLAAAIERQVNGAAFTVIRSEQGILPMGLVAPPAHAEKKKPNFVFAGQGAGAARPATGYAFQRIQRWAQSCSSLIAQGKPPIGHPKDSALQAKMDTIFLNVIRQQPELAPSLFVDLFSRVKTQRVINFLNDCPSLLDYTAVVMALPARPFLSQAFK
jgi:lycopene beta-cyclase